jgi:hypothetical protein
MARGLKKLSAKDREDIGTLEDLMAKVWEGVETASQLLKKNDDATKFKAVHALAQIGGIYRSLLETSELQDRLEALEEKVLGATA